MSAEISDVQVPKGPRAIPVRKARGGGLIGLVFLAAAAAAMMQQEQIRAAEAWLMAAVFDGILGGASYSVDDIIFHNVGGGQPFALQVTGLCSSAVLLAPIAGLAGVLFLMGRIPVSRLMPAAIIALVIVSVSNATRYFMIAAAQQSWGQQGFDLMHHFLGSFVVIFGFVAAIIVLVRAAVVRKGRSGSRPKGRRAS
ncbi:exosortase S [Paenarthrobacter aurescens]|nr:exosortase S [Paenarthrobacter aurescens]MDO6142627.1 exosortase S [Paenarthrobacter aurescens]MDO6146474.1 exosortase S [Paenarthrobacter aurescens]MDO6157719.1 exosortase S [Paenarthrobacter aurescens]MDO6161704.1 exosortase S [Paenarthrobacter aurescens]